MGREALVQESDRLLVLNHSLRQQEHALMVAVRRRRWSNISLVLGPIFGLLLYAIYYAPFITRQLRIAVYIPAIPLALAFAGAAIFLKVTPGFPNRPLRSEKRIYTPEGDLELDLARLRDERKLLMANLETPYKVRRIAYKEDAAAEIDYLRKESNQYRRVNNLLQGVLIVGALAATGASGVIGEYPMLRWATLGLSFVVGASSGFMGYFKYKERSFYLQQTADSIEGELEAVDVGVGRYKRIDDEEVALAEFVEEVHRLKMEQKKRQQNLEQPPDARTQGE